MFKEVCRLLAFIGLVIIIIFDDFPFYNKIKTPQVQLVLAILVVIALFYDTIFGLLLGLVLLLIYYEIYKKIILPEQNQQLKIEKQLSEENNNIDTYRPIQQIQYTEQKSISQTKNDDKIPTNFCTGKYDPLQNNEIRKSNKVDYVNCSVLNALQNNIFDENNYNYEIKGFDKGIHNEPVYGCQGLNSDTVNLSGYSPELGFQIVPSFK